MKFEIIMEVHQSDRVPVDSASCHPIITRKFYGLLGTWYALMSAGTSGGGVAVQVSVWSVTRQLSRCSRATIT